MKQKNDNPEYDDRLAEFTDSVLTGRSDRPDSDADDTLRRLEETILHLHRVLPHTDPDRIPLAHLEARLTAHVQRKGKHARLFLWQKWFGWRSPVRVQRLLGVALFLLLSAAILMISLFPPHSSSVAASAYIGSHRFLSLAAFAVAALFLVWLSRHK